VKKAYESVAKQFILWYVYPSFAGEHSGSDFLFIAWLFLWMVYSLQVKNIDNWSSDNPVFNVGSQPVDTLGCVYLLKEVIVRFNGGSCQGCV